MRAEDEEASDRTWRRAEWMASRRIGLSLCSPGPVRVSMKMLLFFSKVHIVPMSSKRETRLKTGDWYVLQMPL